MSRWFSVAILAAALVSTPLRGQHHGPATAGLPSQTLPPPPLMAGIGTATMAISSDSEEARKYFDQGLRLIHCFWDFEAYRAFKEAIRQDPTAAMPYWGVFMSLNYNPTELFEQRREALEKARALASSASDREQRLIRAISRLAPGGADASAAYVEEMEALIAAHPTDLQAQLILIKFLVTDAGGYYSGSAVSSSGSAASSSGSAASGNGSAASAENHDSFARAREMLSPLLRAHPDDAAVNHYWIHAHETGDNPERALASAEKLPSLASGSGHMLHMPGHIYYKIGAYEDAYRSFQASLAFDRQYMEETGVDPVDNWNYVHNLDYLVANCAEDGRYAEGRRYAEQLSKLSAANDRSRAVGLGYLIYGGRTAPARLHLRYGKWKAAAESLAEALESWSFASELGAGYVEALLAYARGMNAVETGDFSSAGQQFQILVANGLELTQRRSEEPADWYFQAAQRIVAIAMVELGGTVTSIQGQHRLAIGQLGKAILMEDALGYGEPPHYSRPVGESLAGAYLRSGKWDEAITAYQQVLEERPNTGHAWVGIARAHVSAGRTHDATRAYRKLLTVWRSADPDLTAVVEARAWIREHG